MVSNERESRVVMRILNQRTEKCAFSQVKVNMDVLVATVWSVCLSQLPHASGVVKLVFFIRISSVMAEMFAPRVFFVKSQTVCTSGSAESS
jgi:hypothetical protein